jgi:uncharacterized membrane protein
MHLRSSLEIGKPANEVFDVVADFARNPEWQGGMRSATWTSEPPVRIGSTYEQVARFLGRDVETTFEVVGYEPGRSITIESRASSFPIRVTRAVEPLTETTSRVTAEVSGEPGRFFRLFGPFLARIAERSVRRDYRRLRDLLESG